VCARFNIKNGDFYTETGFEMIIQFGQIKTHVSQINWLVHISPYVE